MEHYRPSFILHGSSIDEHRQHGSFTLAISVKLEFYRGSDTRHSALRLEVLFSAHVGWIDQGF
jgi:hypothetical protein